MEFNDVRALITGGAGFIGSHIGEELVRKGADKVVLLDNLATGTEANIEEWKDERTIFVKGDIRDASLVRQLLMDYGINVIFHNAAQKWMKSINDPHGDLDVNARGTLTVLQAAVDCNVGKFIHASTGSVYGEPEYYPCDEEHPKRPCSPYGVSKLAGENYCHLFHRLYGLQTVVLRYHNVYGPRQKYTDEGGVVLIFIRRAMHNEPQIIFGDGTQVRSFTFVKDVVNANFLALMKAEAVGKAYNLASGIQETVRALAERIYEKLGKDRIKPIYAARRAGDIKRLSPDISLIRRELGFVPQYSFEQGLEETISWLSKRI